MKKYRWTALLLALVLAAGVCAGCGKKQADAPAQDNQIQTNPDEVTAVTYTNGTITLRFSLQDGRWCWSDDKTFPLDGSYITALLADVQGGPPISITEEDLESYGLGGVTKYIEITTAEKTATAAATSAATTMSPPSTARRTTSPRGSTAASMTWRSCPPSPP